MRAPMRWTDSPKRQRPSPSSRQSNALLRPAGRERQSDDPFGDVALPAVRYAGRSRLVAKKAIHTFPHESRLPAPDASLGLARSAHDLVRADAVGGKQNDLRPPDMLFAAAFRSLRTAPSLASMPPIRQWKFPCASPKLARAAATKSQKGLLRQILSTSNL